MVIDGLTSTEVYVEKPSLVKILCDKNVNQNGILEIDNNNNKLVSNIDSGDTPLFKLSNYSGANSLLLFNPTTQEMQLCKNGDLLHIRVDFDKGTRYFINAKYLESTSVDVSTKIFTIDGLEENDIIHRIFMNGRIIKNYQLISNGIKITGAEALLVDKYTQINVYTYQSNKITDSTIIEIDYYQYPVVFDLDVFFETNYLDEIKGMPVNNFESLSITQNVSKTVFRGNFRYSNKSRVNSIDNTIDLECFGVSRERDLIHFIGLSEFRMILINRIFGRAVLVNNCKNSNGTSLIYDKSKNTKKISLSCGNYIDISISDPSLYGVDRYGIKQYSGSLYVINSHNAGE